MKVPAWSRLNGCLDSVPDSQHSFRGSLYMVPWLRNEGSWLPALAFCFLGLSEGLWFSGLGSLVKVAGSLDLAPWLPGEGSCLPGITSWFHVLGSMVVCVLGSLIAWIRFLVPWTWFHGCLVKVPGCLDSLPHSMELVPWLHVEGGICGFLDMLDLVA